MVLKFVLLSCLCASFVTNSLRQSERFNKTKSREKHAKLFSLFSIVQFPNTACSSSSSTFPNGTCLTSSECTTASGTAQGGCASGFGVCCIFSISTTGSTLSQNCTYITNPGYPSDFTTDVKEQTFIIEKSSSDVCRIRLDYEEFVLTAPELGAANIISDGQCIIDRLTFTTTSEVTESIVGAAVTSYGNYPYICGTNTGQHSYLDLSCTDGDTATLKFTLGDAANNKYKIKVTQLSCNDMCVASQSGCFQYFTGVTNTIKSYNFDDSSSVHLASQNYNNCIRQEEGYCCIEYKADTFLLPTLAAGADCTDAVIANLCTNSKSCSLEYILIPGVQNPSALNNLAIKKLSRNQRQILWKCTASRRLQYTITN